MSIPATPLSTNEIRFFFTRAAVGAGAPYGIGEELTRAALWLAALGADPGEVAAPALDALASGRSTSRLGAAGDPPVLSGGGAPPVSALYAGPAAADRLTAGARQITLQNVDAPALAAALVAALCPDRPINASWRLLDGIEVLLTSSGENAALTGCDVTTLAKAAPGDVAIRIGTAAPADAPVISIARGRQATLTRGITLGPQGWACVSGHFRKCLVPSTAESRASGAGAGLTDND